MSETLRKKHTTTIGDVGEFTFKCPNIGETIQIGANVARNWFKDLTPETIDPQTDTLAMMIETLNVVTVSRPDGFLFEEVEDLQALLNIFKAYRDWRDSFRGGANTEGDPPDGTGGDS